MSVEVADDNEAEKPALIGEVLANRYQIESAIGEGAMGAVFKAKHVKVGRAFAVKVLHKRLVEDHKTLQRFEREAELAGRLRHPNVIGVVDIGETTDGFRYMVMDFAQGSDLATVLGEAPMRPERVIHLTRQMLEGLYHAHEQGLIHRDFKPENVIIERDDHGAEVPRIVDFGIAILREGGDSTDGTGRLTTNGLVLGTPHYMAPEQAVADPIDHRIDLFALGIVIYEMLCGKLPFDGTGAEVARANLLLDPPAISQRVPFLEVDPLLEAYARRLMAKKRDQRPATAKAARELLDLITNDPKAAAAALGVPLDTNRAPATTQPVSVQRQAVPEDDEVHPAESRTPIPPTPMLYGRAPTPHPFGDSAPAVELEAPAYAPKAEQRGVRTDAAAPLEWERPARGKRPLIFIVGGALVLLAIVIVIATRGSKTVEEPKVAETTIEPPKLDPIPEVKPDPKPEAKVEPPKVDDPIEIARPDPKKPVVQKPQPKKPDPKPPVIAKPDKAPDPPQPPKATKLDAAGLIALYGAVGRELANASKTLGDDVVAGLRASYRLIQVQDAMSTEPKREAAGALLQKIRAQLAALPKQKA